MNLRIITLLFFLLFTTQAWALDLAPSSMLGERGSNAITPRDSGSASLTADEIKGEFFGRVRSTMVYHNFEQGQTSYNYLDTTTDARLGYTVKKQAGDWMTSATIDFNIRSADSSTEARYLYVTIEDKEYSLRLGRQEPGGSTLGGKYLQSIDETLVIGETIGDGDYLTLRYKPAGLKLVSGRHAGRNDAGAEGDTPNDEMAGAIFWEGGFGGHSFTASYTEIHETVNVVAQQEASTTHGAETYKGSAAAWQIPLGAVHLSLNFDQLDKEYLDSDQASLRTQTFIGFFDIKVTEDSGFTLAYSEENTQDGSPNPTKYRGGDLGFSVTHGILRFYVGVNSSLTEDLDSSAPIKTSQFGLGIGAFFK